MCSRTFRSTCHFMPLLLIDDADEDDVVRDNHARSNARTAQALLVTKPPCHQIGMEPPAPWQSSRLQLEHPMEGPPQLVPIHPRPFRPCDGPWAWWVGFLVGAVVMLGAC